MTQGTIHDKGNAESIKLQLRENISIRKKTASDNFLHFY